MGAVGARDGRELVHVELLTPEPEASLRYFHDVLGMEEESQAGQSVFHAKFGEGVIVTLEGVGSDARAQINFGRHGMKWLALSVAKLTPIE